MHLKGLMFLETEIIFYMQMWWGPCPPSSYHTKDFLVVKSMNVEVEFIYMEHYKRWCVYMFHVCEWIVLCVHVFCWGVCIVFVHLYVWLHVCMFACVILCQTPCSENSTWVTEAKQWSIVVKSKIVFCYPQSNKPLSEGLSHQIEEYNRNTGLPSISIETSQSLLFINNDAYLLFVYCMNYLL